MGDQYLSEIRIMAFSFPPKGWAFCEGQILPIAQNQALFALVGTEFGGDGQKTFALPDLRGRIPAGAGRQFSIGQKGGEMGHTLNGNEMPRHSHALMADGSTDAATNTSTPAPPGTKVLGKSAGSDGTHSKSWAVTLYSDKGANATLAPAAIGNAGGGQAHSNAQPFLALNFCIALQGIFPSRS
jgi:microcystin-dependent protein